MASLARKHSAALEGAAAHADTPHDHSAADPSDGAPLQALKKLIASVTEFLTTAFVIVAAVAAALAAAPRTLRPRRMALDVPKPPPRLRLASS